MARTYPPQGKISKTKKQLDFSGLLSDCLLQSEKVSKVYSKKFEFFFVSGILLIIYSILGTILEWDFYLGKLHLNQNLWNILSYLGIAALSISYILIQIRDFRVGELSRMSSEIATFMLKEEKKKIDS